ncbi:MAG: SHOCT domain-containing protein [Thermoleophilia bacterium]
MGLLRMAARTAVVAGTATAVSGRVAHRQAQRYAEQQPQYAEPPPQQYAPPPPAAPAEDEQIAKLQELAQLHQQGILSDDEFSAAKAKVLGL